jgi:hypothetical protein
MAVILWALRAGHALLPRTIFWYSFLLEAESTPGPSVALSIKWTENIVTSSELESASFRLVA